MTWLVRPRFFCRKLLYASFFGAVIVGFLFCVKTDQSPQCLAISSAGSLLNVRYIPQGGAESCNPFFPSLVVSTDAQHDAWIHIVRTDSDQEEYRLFVDGADSQRHPEIYPFYTFEKDFYDAPLWCYTLLSKPLSYWEGHVYAVVFDRETGEMLFSGGVSWGFTFPHPFALFPQGIKPKALTFEDFIKDLEVFESICDKT